MTRRKTLTMNSSDIIFGAKSVINGMFRQNAEFTEIDDPCFISMLKTCINTTVENVRQAGLSESEAKAIHDELYQYSLDEYVKWCLSNARQYRGDIDEEEEVEEATESFVSFYEGEED